MKVKDKRNTISHEFPWTYGVDFRLCLGDCERVKQTETSGAKSISLLFLICCHVIILSNAPIKYLFTINREYSCAIILGKQQICCTFVISVIC